MAYFLLLRIKQTQRIFNEIGFLRSLIILIFIIIAVSKIILTGGVSVMIGGATLISVISIHLTRKDKKLLNSIFDKTFFVYAVEYLIISIPAILSLALNENWIVLLTLLAGLVVVSLSSFGEVVFNASFLKIQILSTLPVEWISGIRKNWPGLLILYITALFTSSYSTAIPLLIVVSTIIICSFFNECEPYQMVDLYSCSSKRFLILKYQQHLKNLWLIYSPLLILYLLFFPWFWYVPLGTLLICSLTLILAVSSKYASYQPNEELSMNMITVVLSVCCFLIPFLAPLPFFIIVRNHRRAVKNIDHYLYAFN